ncbi:MAG: sterol desaturase family protein [Ectothiorhodospiraceae bacterium]|nr:sterol desaturase family protein [Ectothiorhodospiraceae bacterium]
MYLINALLLIGTFLMMELVAWAAHKYVMHGWGWGWHRSHHQPSGRGWFEKNDLYAVVFAGLAIVLIFIGSGDYGPTYWSGFGRTAYGLAYFLFHDGLVHRRWPFNYAPRSGYLKRLVQAHKIHHAVREKDGCVSFGFLYARPLPELKQDLQRQRESG